MDDLGSAISNLSASFSKLRHIPDSQTESLKNIEENTEKSNAELAKIRMNIAKIEAEQKAERTELLQKIEEERSRAEKSERKNKRLSYLLAILSFFSATIATLVIQWLFENYITVLFPSP